MTTALAILALVEAPLALLGLRFLRMIWPIMRNRDAALAVQGLLSVTLKRMERMGPAERQAFLGRLIAEADE